MSQKGVKRQRYFQKARKLLWSTYYALGMYHERLISGGNDEPATEEKINTLDVQTRFFHWKASRG